METVYRIREVKTGDWYSPTGVHARKYAIYGEPRQAKRVISRKKTAMRRMGLPDMEYEIVECELKEI